MKLCDTYCTGCGLCEQMCPVGAIKWKQDEDMGHFRPFIEQSKCIQCQKCRNICPQNSPVEKNEAFECYAAWNSDSILRKKCSSGGIATAIYHDIIEKKGYAAGTVLETDEVHFKLYHTDEEIEDFRGSKYVQPHMDSIYKDVIEKLKDDKRVVFIGLPCQCAAMIKVAKNYRNNLLVVDLVCHGVPAEIALHEHIQELLKRQKQSVYENEHTAIAFRDPAMAVCLSLSTEKRNIYHHGLHEDEYMHAFITGNLFAESCYNCQYACEKRVSDLTIGDFWGVGKEIPLKNKISRPSLVLVNTEQGKKYWQELQRKLIIEPRMINEALQGNEQLQHPAQKGNDRENLKQIARKSDWGTAMVTIYGQLVNKNYNRRMRIETIKKFLTFIGIKKIYDIFKQR